MSQEVMQSRPIKLMGNNLDITLVAKDFISTNEYVDTAISEIIRIEPSIALWEINYLTSEIITDAGVLPVKVDKELFFDLVVKCKHVSKLTNGAFDISYTSIDEDNKMHISENIKLNQIE